MKKNTQALTENQKLQFSKYNSNLLREKLLLNEKMIFQHYLEREYNLLKEKNVGWERYFNQNLSNQNKQFTMDLSQKYDVVRKELENANNKWELFETKKDQLTDELLATNQEIISNIKDIKMEVYDLNRKIDIQSDNPNKSTKISAEIFHKFFQEKEVKQKAIKTKLNEQNKSLRAQLIKANKKLQDKDKTNDREFIDFHQLQIENKKYVKEVDEKNKSLLKLKMTIGKITQDKNAKKDELNAAEKILEEKKKGINEKNAKIQSFKKMIQAQNDKTTKINNKVKNLREKELKAGNNLTVSIIILHSFRLRIM